jgi:phage I-like protein
MVTGRTLSSTVEDVKFFGRKTSRKAALLASSSRGRATLNDHLVLPLALDGAGKAPTEFCIFKAGDNTSEKGTYLFDDLAQELVLGKYAQRGVPMMMDYEHQSMVEPPIEAPASAREFVPEVRNGELWATKILWNDRARAYLEGGEYRLFSPAFSYEKLPDGRMRVTKLINVALTNNPALHNIEPLMAAKDDDDMDEMEKMKAQLKALQEKCDALATANTSLSSENASLSAQLKSKKDAEPDEGETKATAALRDEVVTITGKKDLKEATGVLRSIALKAKTSDQAVLRLAEIEAEGRDKEFTALLDDGFKEGKISKAQRDQFWEKKSRGEDKHVTVEGLAMLKDFLPTAPVQVSLRASAQKDGKSEPYSKDEKATMLRMGITDPKEIEQFEAFRAAQSA